MSEGSSMMQESRSVRSAGDSISSTATSSQSPDPPLRSKPKEFPSDTYVDSVASSFHWHTAKLYGRSREGSFLLQRYRQMTDDQQPALIAISGKEGTGKTALAGTLREPVTEDGGYFLQGKWDGLLRAEPYAAFVSAFQEFSNLVMSRGADTIVTMREAIQSAVPDDEMRILIDMIPALENLVGLNTCGSFRHHQETQVRIRFAFVFRKFMKAVCSCAKPLVLLLDDLHFADQCSLDLLASLVPDDSHTGMLFVVTCKDAASTCPVSKLLSRLEDMNVSVSRVFLGNLHDGDVNTMVSDILQLPWDGTKHLTEYVYQETSGNVYFVLEFLRTLEDKGILRFAQNTRRWVLDDARLYVEMESIRVGDLIVERMMKQPPSLQAVLKVASCLGSKIDEVVLECVLSTSVSKLLDLGAEQGFLIYNWEQDDFSFSHDTVQKAAYMLIPKEDRNSFHVFISRKLRQSLTASELDRYIYVLLTQYRVGAAEIKTHREKYDIAELCLRAAEKAVSASSFPTASLYLDFGIQILGELMWKEAYDLSLALHNTSAEVNYCTGNFASVHSSISAVFKNARSFHDKLSAHATEVYMFSATNKQEQALNEGLKVLRKLGEPISPRPSAWRVSNGIRKIKHLTRWTDDELLELPLMRDQDKLASMRMLDLIFLSACMCEPQLAAAIALRMMKLTLKYGLSAMSSSAFVLYGVLLCNLPGNADEGYRFGRLSLVLLDRFKLKQWLPRVYAWMYGAIILYKRPFRYSIEPLKSGFVTGLEFGDIEYSALNASIHFFISIDAGKPLDVVATELERFMDVMTLQRQESSLAVLRPFMNFIRNLTGQSHEWISSTGQLRLAQTVVLSESAVTRNAVNELTMNYHRMVLAYLFADYRLASQMGERCCSIGKHPFAGFDKYSVAFLVSLSSLALMLEFDIKDKKKHLSIVRKNEKMLKVYARESPHNCLAGLSLVQAEQAALSGDRKLAYSEYLVAISVAQEEGLLNVLSIATERAARYLLFLNEDELAALLLQRSHEAYLEWGAKAKASQLKSEFTEYIP